ncbi:MAG: hypothetical protein Q9227_002659 [Pyrenula ochraceoflavens]
MPLRAKLLNRDQSRKISTSESYGEETFRFRKEQPDDDPSDVLFSSIYGVRSIELNRPKKHNSLNGSMIRKILPRLAEWRKSDLADVVMISGAGTKAFCAGGDVAALAEQNDSPAGQDASKDYFSQEYQLDHYIATYEKPYIAVMDGITMGGGVGLSVHAPFRIATEKTVFAMPETDIGFFPDVGASFFLPRLDGKLGAYLAMTSDRLTGADVYRAGIATHYLDSSVLAPLTTRLAELNFPDYYNLPRRNQIIDETIREFCTDLPASPASNPNLYGDTRYLIDTCFSHTRLEQIYSSLESIASSSSPQNATWATKTLSTLRKRCPLSLAVTVEQMSLGNNLSIYQTFTREHAVASQFMSHPKSDFNEGIKAKLVEKRTPNWSQYQNPQELDALASDFWRTPRPSEQLKLVNTRDYKEYQWKFGLPGELEMLEEMRGKRGDRERVDACVEKWEGKVGVEEKARDVCSRYQFQ